MAALMKAAHKESYIASTLRGLLKIKNLKQSDIRQEVTDAVVAGILTAEQFSAS